MNSDHRANVFVMSCLKTPVHPLTKAPLASYERARATPENGEQMGSDFEFDSDADERLQDEVCGPLSVTDGCKLSGRIDLRELSSSNKEYYRKLEQLRRTQLCTMADLKLMNIKNLERKSLELMNGQNGVCLMKHHRPNSTPNGNLKTALSAHELRSITYMDEVCSPQVDHLTSNVSKYLPGSQKERIKNMWRGFRIGKKSLSWQPKPSASPENYPEERQAQVESKGQRTKKRVGWCPIVTMPKPFQMTLRESKCKPVRSCSEIEYEIEKLQRELEELTECQRKFRATPMPAHVRLPLYEALRVRDAERRREFRAAERERLLAIQVPFSFLEREEIKKQQKELKTLLSTKKQEKHMMRQFRAKPVPRAVKEAASGEREKEEQLYREIKKEMRATEMLLSAAQPASMLAKRQSERRARKEEPPVHQKNAQHRSRLRPGVPDFDTSFGDTKDTSFQKQLAGKKDFRPLTTCIPFNLLTANNSSRKDRLSTKAKAELRNQSASNGIFMSFSPFSSSVCSSASKSHEYLPTKITGAAKKRQEAVRKVLEQKKKAEQDKEKLKGRQRQKEKKLQKLISKRAQAYDPHVSLAQICEPRLKEFRKRDLQRRREYEEELREMQERVESRPLLLEQVTQTNAKWAAEKQFNKTLRALGLNVASINRNTLTSDRAISGGSEVHTSFIHRKDKTVDHVKNADSEDVEDIRIVRKSDENGYAISSYEDGLEFNVNNDDYDDDDDDQNGYGDDDDGDQEDDDYHVHDDDGDDYHEHDGDDQDDGDDYHEHDDGDDQDDDYHEHDGDDQDDGDDYHEHDDGDGGDYHDQDVDSDDDYDDQDGDDDDDDQHGDDSSI